MLAYILQVALIIVTTFLSPGLSVDPLVDLSYSRYVGQPLVNGITQWLGIRYAAPPVGNLRFEPPQDPLFVAGIQSASQHGKICLGTGDSPSNTATSEDCLFLDIYAPTDATIQCNLPVFVFIQGGGFSSNSEANLNGTGLITASGNNIIVITLNYRVGPYGFLSDGKNGYLKANNGLRDQRKVLEWVQKNIVKFGGNPRHVVLGGASAGAASVSLHMVAYEGKDYGLFHAAAADSVSFSTLLTADESAYQYENLAIRLGCVSATSNQTISCLRSKSALELQSQNFNIPFPGAASPPLFMWGPVIDNDIVTDLTCSSFEAGKFIRIPMIVGDDTNGGTIFAPRTTSSQAQSNQFIKNQFPYITLPQLSKLNELYPNPYPHHPHPNHHVSNDSSDPPQDIIKGGTWWRQLSNVYGEMRYMCPGLFINTALRKHGVGSSYAYRWNVEDKAQMDAGLGVPHTAEVSAIFGPSNIPAQGPRSYHPNSTNSHAVEVIQWYWTSFIRSYDPNLRRYSGSAEWKVWSGDGFAENKISERLLFDTGGQTKMETVDGGLRSRCEYLSGLGKSLHQ